MNKKILFIAIILSLFVFILYKNCPCIIPGKVCPQYKNTFRIITYQKEGIPIAKLVFMRNLREYFLVQVPDGNKYRSISNFDISTDLALEKGSGVGSGTPFMNLKNNNLVQPKKDEVEKYVYTDNFHLIYGEAGTRYFKNNDFVVNVQITKPYVKYRIARYDSVKENDLFYELELSPKCGWRPEIQILDEKDRAYLRILCMRKDEKSINYKVIGSYYYFNLSNFGYLGEKPESYLGDNIFSPLFEEYRPDGTNMPFNKEKITTQPGAKDEFIFGDTVISQVHRMKQSTELDPVSYSDFYAEVSRKGKVLFKNRTRNNSLDQVAFSEDMKNLYLRYDNGDLYIVTS